MKHSAKLLLGSLLLACYFSLSTSDAQRPVVPQVITPTVTPAGAMNPVVIKPALPVSSGPILIYQTSPQQPVQVIVVPPPPAEASHAPHVHLHECQERCNNSCSDSTCRELCVKNAC